MPAAAADRPGRPEMAGPQALFQPTRPDGVASDLPRSPLADGIVNGNVRFASRAQAQARCPHDAIVWVELGSNHERPAWKAHEDGWPGAFMCAADASMEGDRP